MALVVLATLSTFQSNQLIQEDNLVLSKLTKDHIPKNESFIFGNLPGDENFVKVSNPHIFVKVTKGREHMILLTNKGVLLGIGSNSKGQLGLKSSELSFHSQFFELEVPSNYSKVLDFACLAYSTLLIAEEIDSKLPILIKFSSENSSLAVI